MHSIGKGIDWPLGWTALVGGRKLFFHAGWRAVIFLGWHSSDELEVFSHNRKQLALCVCP